MVFLVTSLSSFSDGNDSGDSVNSLKNIEAHLKAEEIAKMSAGFVYVCVWNFSIGRACAVLRGSFAL